MRDVFRIAILLVFFMALGACVLGEEKMVSPYASAYFQHVEGAGVADGRTPLAIRVRGEVGATLTLSVQAAEFVGSAEASKREKTVQLAVVDSSGEGVADVLLVSNEPGLATLSFKVAPLENSIEVAFAPVKVEVGQPRAIEVGPGEIVHEVCIYANTAHGSLRLAASVGVLVPQVVELTMSDSESSCPARDAWAGITHLRWSSAEDSSDLSIRYVGANGEQLPVLTAQLRGELFPGYQVGFANVAASESWTQLEVQLNYRETLSIGGGPASQVPLRDLRSVPTGMRLVGSSSGDGAATPQTDADGLVTLYFENLGTEPELSIFATPEGGGTLHLATLPAPEGEH